MEALASKIEHINIMRDVTVAACNMAADGLRPVEHMLRAVRDILEKRKTAGATLKDSDDAGVDDARCAESSPGDHQ